ncbi:electron transport complex subunit RsxC [Pseudoalteromonas obscura]|uniref:Ion-translocating oxidoreductase complex subunit C n=1 Tax=Pseudoalteromonas obscura TaxID=3048491 RepID=A0ABT7EIH5_9GAMM|nr:electron transport complex subunit RsxC [Pseudoalteromonas sp. P94(2023)]MDK2594818.1 electron transport complex subunit RsxC [Pseudoalteromonas sp. P94(2023)]
METLLEQIESGKLWQFPGGIHPPEQKSISNQVSIGSLPLPEYLVLPLKQHIGANGQLLVNKGEHVLKGQVLTQPGTNWSLPIHAPTSGTITDIKPMPSAHPSAMPELSIVLTPDGEDKWCDLQARTSIDGLDNKALIDIIHHAGIAGMGGAGFPTYVKADSAKTIEFLVVNGVECEPYITADDMLMREHAEDIIRGIEVMSSILSPQCTLVGIEDNKPEALAAMKLAAQHNDKILVRAIPTKYPSGGEKQLIKVLTSKEVPSGGIPADVGVLVQNVGTLFAVSEAVYKGKPLIERVVTVTGNTIQTPQNVWALLGSEVKHLLYSQGFTPVDEQRVIMGGPMMGFTLPTVRIPVVKTTNCVLAPDNQELAVAGQEQACIRCSACADACPQTLLPQQLQWFAKGQEYDKLEEYNLFDCIECGACSYVCPSEIPLVQYYRVAKAEIREQKLEKVKAERAKERFEARKVRLEKEQEERQNRHKRPARSAPAKDKAKVSEALERVKKKRPEQSAVQAAIERAKAKKADGDATTLEPDNSAVALERAKRKEQARKYKEEKAGTDQGSAPKDAVAAAIARAKAKKAEKAAAESEAQDPRKAAVAAAIARAKAKKADKETGKASSEAPIEATADDPRKAAVAAAIARAKAKKAAKTPSEQTEVENPATEVASEDPRKAAVAAAIARAKAKKAAKATAEQTEELVHEEPVTEEAPEDPRKAAVAAAIARAKAKKAAKAAAEQAEEPVNEEPAIDEAPEDPRKAAVAAAIARAKAKKAAKAAAEQAEEQVSEEPAADEAPEDPRKAAVAAAIARAKAKKAAKAAAEQAEEQVSEEPAADEAPEDPRKAAVAAAIARAKAKKAAKAAAEQAEEQVSEESAADEAPEDPRKAAVAAAIARAKAKKAAKEAEQTRVESTDTTEENSTSIPESELNPEDKRKAAIRAAVERAKAKKKAQEQEGNDLS